MKYVFKSEDRNKEIMLAKGNIPLWAIALKLGVHEQTLHRWLRVEVDETKKQRILEAINQIKQGQ